MTDPSQPETQPDPSPPGPAYAAPTGPRAKSGAGAVVVIVVVMLLAGGAIGYFGGKALEEEDEQEPVSASATTAPAEPPAAPDPSVWAQSSGTFQAAFPDGMVVGSDKYGPGQTALAARPGDAANSLYDAGGITVVFDRRPDMTPETVLEVDPPSSCPDDAGQEPYVHGAFTGIVHTFTGCPNGYRLRRIAVAVEGGTNLAISSATTDGDDTAVERALDTFVPGADPATQVAPAVGCADIEASPEAEWPFSLFVKNHRDDQVSYGWLDQATGLVDDPQELPSGFVTGTIYVKTGEVYRFTTPDGDVDYTVVDEQYQCVLLTDDGFEPVPG